MNTTVALATISCYFRLGLEVGLCREDDVRDWAFVVIDSFDHPPDEVFELSWQYPRARLFENLNAVQGSVDLGAVQQWLLAAIHTSMTPHGSLHQYLKQAFYVVRATGQPEDDLYYTLEAIADDLQLAEIGLVGDAAECREELCLLLRNYAPAPFVHGWAGIDFDASR